MTERKTYYGSVGPFFHDDAVEINDADGDFSGEYQKGMHTEGKASADQGPTQDKDLIRLQDFEGVFKVIEVSDITNPTELNSITASKAGSLILVFQKVASDYNYVTFYSYDTDGPAASPPEVVDAGGSGSERWIAVAGKYEARPSSSTTTPRWRLWLGA